MTAELAELYRETLADHARRPRNFYPLPDATAHADAHNPTCGDRVTIWVKVQAGMIVDSSFQGSGCSISTSSASMLTDAIKGLTVPEARALFDRFHQMLTSSVDAPIDEEAMGKLACFAGVRKYPIRVKCATLPWHTLDKLIGARESI